MLEIVANWMSGWIDSYILGSNEAVSFAAVCYLTTQASSGVLNNSPENNMLRRSHMLSIWSHSFQWRVVNKWHLVDTCLSIYNKRHWCIFVGVAWYSTDGACHPTANDAWPLYTDKTPSYRYRDTLKTILVPCPVVESPWLIWRSGICVMGSTGARSSNEWVAMTWLKDDMYWFCINDISIENIRASSKTFNYCNNRRKALKWLNKVFSENVTDNPNRYTLFRHFDVVTYQTQQTIRN